MPGAKDVRTSDRQADGPGPVTDGPTDAIQTVRTQAERRRQQRLTAAAVIGAIVAIFALMNLNDVKVHWVVTTVQTPLIVVIVLAFLLGIVADRLLLRARAKRKQGTES